MSDIVAIFWDFEQLHNALMFEKHGHSGINKVRGRLQPKAINIDVVMDYARSFGQVFINEAYGNWHWMSRYAEALELEEAALIQVFPRDQHEASDVFPTLVKRVKLFVERNVEVTTIVLVGLNDDYVLMTDKLRDLGCTVHGVGAAELRDRELQSHYDDYLDYYDLPGAPSRPGKQRPSHGNSTNDLAKYYLRVAAQQGVRMPPPNMMWIGIDIYASFLKDYIQFNSFKELDEECYDQLIQDVPGANMTEVKKIRQVLFKCYLFRPSEDGMISFQESIKDLEDIENCYFELMLRRIANNLQEPVDYNALSLALTDSEDSAERLEQMHPNVTGTED